MKNFLAKIKAFILAAIAWLCSWPKDLIIQFSLADNITFIALLLYTPIVIITDKGWLALLFSFITTSVVILYKDKGTDTQFDWRSIAAGYIGLGWGWIKYIVGFWLLSSVF